MSLVIFSTPGPINLDALLTFGVNAKDPDNPSPIGFFGTGFKYALAVILRGGGKLTIHRQDHKAPISFEVRPTVIRDKEFGIIHYRIGTLGNTHKLAFTTALGPTWEPWMAFRELEANTRDEGGVTWAPSPMPEELDSEMSHIVVDWPLFHQAWQERHWYFLPKEHKPLTVTPHVHFYRGSNPRLYYRGMAVYKLAKDKTFRYTYDLQAEMELTEDRTIKYGFMMDHYLQDAVLHLQDEDILSDILTADKQSYEHTLGWNTGSPPPTFTRVVQRLTSDPMTYGRVNRSAEETCRRACPDQMLATVTLNQTQYQMFLDAMGILKRYLQAEIDPNVVYTVASLGTSILGQCANRRIYLSLDAYASLHLLAGTLYEEWCHLACGHADGSAAFQNHLLNALISQVLAREGVA